MNKNVLVGMRQTKKAIEANEAKLVEIARDTDPILINDIIEACMAQNIKYELKYTKQELAEKNNIDVPTAFITYLK